MNDVIETTKYKGYDINISYDNDLGAEDLGLNDECVFILFEHRSFNVVFDDITAISVHNDINGGDGVYDGYWIFGLYAYIHSGVSLSLSRDKYPFTDKWDVSTTGFVLVKKENTIDEDKAYEMAGHTVEGWNEYLMGEVYYHSVDEISAGCGGYLGSSGLEYAKSCAKADIDNHIDSMLKAHLSKLKRAIKSHVPIEYRRPFVEAAYDRSSI